MKKEYEISEFDGSISQSTIQTSTLEQLNNAKSYYESAIRYHTDEWQIKSFSDGLALIGKRIRKLNKKLWTT